MLSAYSLRRTEATRGKNPTRATRTLVIVQYLLVPVLLPTVFASLEALSSLLDMIQGNYCITLGVVILVVSAAPSILRSPSHATSTAVAVRTIPTYHLILSHMMPETVHGFPQASYKLLLLFYKSQRSYHVHFSKSNSKKKVQKNVPCFRRNGIAPLKKQSTKKRPTNLNRHQQEIIILKQNTT